MFSQEGPPNEKSTDEIVAAMANFIRENSFVLEMGSMSAKGSILKEVLAKLIIFILKEVLAKLIIFILKRVLAKLIIFILKEVSAKLLNYIFTFHVKHCQYIQIFYFFYFLVCSTR